MFKALYITTHLQIAEKSPL